MESLHTYLSETRTPPDRWHLLNKLPNPKPPYREPSESSESSEPSTSAQCGTQLPPIAHVPRLSLRAPVPPQYLPEGQFHALPQEATLFADATIGDPRYAEQSRCSVQPRTNSSNKKRRPQIYEQPGGPSTNHDYYPQQNMSRAQPVVVPIMTQSSGAMVRRQSTYSYASNSTTVQREEVVRVEESLEFVTFNGPPVKNDPASRSRIKAHVMRQIHQQKRIEKMAKSQARTLPAQSLHTCGCNETTSFNTDSVAQQLPPRTKSLATRAVDSHVNTTTDSGNNQWPAGFSVGVSCQKCGNIEIFRCQTEEALTYRPYTASPRDVLPGRSVLNPFSPFSVTVTHFMHEMIHHCKIFYPEIEYTQLADGCSSILSSAKDKSRHLWQRQSILACHLPG